MNKVEKNIPIPPRRTGGRPPKYDFRNMEVGDSIFAVERAICTAAHKFGERAGWAFLSRQVDGGYRVWRKK